MDELQKATVRAIVNVFETGQVRGHYSAVAVLKGDAGHLSYGRCQATLASGNLCVLLERYCAETGARFATELKPLLPRFRARDCSLDADPPVLDLLKRAGSDAVMHAVQDRFFDDCYLLPAMRAAESTGITQPLGHAVVYDSHIQGGWKFVRALVPKPAGFSEQDWIRKYIDARANWLLSMKPPLPATVFRMNAFRSLVEAGNWSLALPLEVHGVRISAADLAENIGGTPARFLRLTRPYLRGRDVEDLQRALAARGLENTPDGVYGPFTDSLVKAWQARHRLSEDGVGSETRKSLGL